MKLHLSLRALFFAFSYCALTSSTPSPLLRRHTPPVYRRMQFFSYSRYSQIEFIEKKKLGTKKAKRAAEEERKKAPRNIQ